MWLINASTLKLERFQTNNKPYAILSHTWSADHEEVSFEEFRGGQGTQKQGYRKIVECCSRACEQNIPYAWVDTCCIDKSSSAELSESINSMFRWYKDARICYVYLADVSLTCEDSSGIGSEFVAFENSKWFKRGWTLQELIAPEHATFYSHDWIYIDTKRNLAQTIGKITGIDIAVLDKRADYLDCTVGRRMSWASSRQTTRLEDEAYCLLGLFGINMPLQYGEGAEAFIRLQEEIVKQSNDDETIFAWDGVPSIGYGLFAPGTRNFKDAARICRDEHSQPRRHYYTNRRGFRIECQMLPHKMNTYLVPLNCRYPGGKGSLYSSPKPEKMVNIAESLADLHLFAAGIRGIRVVKHRHKSTLFLYPRTAGTHKFCHLESLQEYH